MKKIESRTPPWTPRFTGIIVDRSDVEGDDDSRVELICDNCRQNLVKISDHGGNNEEWFCRHCVVPFYPSEKQLRHKKVLGTRQRAQDMETYVASTPLVDTDSVAIRHSPEVKGALKALRDKGIKITHYEEHIPK